MIFPGRVAFGSKALLGDVVSDFDPLAATADLPVSGATLPKLPDGSPDWRYLWAGLTVAPNAQGQAVYSVRSSAAAPAVSSSLLMWGAAGLLALVVLGRRG